MEKKRGAKRSLFAKIICSLFIIVMFTFIFTSCLGGTTKTHSCFYGGTQLTDDNKDAFEYRVENKNQTGTFFYYLGENITLSNTLQIPEGTYVGICVDEFKITVSNSAPLYTIVDTDGDDSNNVGGVYLFSCGTHAIHSKVSYQYVDQAAIDLFGNSGTNFYNTVKNVGGNYYISLRGDVSIPASYTSMIIPGGKTLYVCTNGHKFNYSVNLEQNGGRLALLDCKNEAFHECLYLDDGAVAITQADMGQLAGAFTDAISGEEFHVYLNGDISWEGEIAIPEGVTVVMCLNGHSATGQVKKGEYTVTVTDENGEEKTETRTYGELIVFDCSHHLCSGVCMTGEMLALNNNSVDWTEALLAKHFADPENPTTVYCVLEDDIEVPLIEGVNLIVCVNGFKNRENQWITKTVDGDTVTTGGIIYYNCASSHSCEIASMVGLENKSILLDTAEGVNLFLSQLEELSNGSSIVAACFSLTADLKGTGEIAAPEGTYAILCLNGYSMGDVTVAEGGNVLVYECNKEYCSEMKNDVMALDQGTIDLLYMYSLLTGQPYPINANYIFALSEDIEVPANAFSVAEGYTVNFCTRGHTIKGVENASGVVTHKGCTHRIAPHICSVADMLDKDSTALKVKSAGAITSAISGLGEGIHFFHLTENLTGSGEITAPEGAIVGICLDGYSKGDVKVAEGSNVFFYECSKHYCAIEKTNIPTFDQGVFDFMAFLVNGYPFTVDYDVTIGISEDVSMNLDIAVLGDNTLRICTCGYNVTFKGISGNVELHDDQNVDAINHYCAVPYLVDAGVNSSPLYATNVADINNALARDAENGFGFYHLTGDIIGGELVVPDNFIVMICLNGFTMQDVVIPENAYVFVYECGVQYCDEVKAYVPAFHQSVFDFLAVAMQIMSGEGGSGEPLTMYVQEDQIIALLSDVTLPFNIVVSEGYTLGICTCGYELNTPDGITLQNVVVHNACKTDDTSAQGGSDSRVTYGCEVCNRMGAKPLNYATLREMMDKEGNLILPKGSHYYYLENDFQLTKMLVIPDGVDLHICLHGYTLYSAYLWNDITTYGAGFPESNCSTFALLLSGATFNIHDCSEKMTGAVTLKQFRMRDSTGKMQLTTEVVKGDSSNTASSIEAIAIGLGSVVINHGTVNIYGGNIYAITGIVNNDNGVLNFYNGNLYAMFAGVISIDINGDGAATNSQVYIGEGATVSSIYMGVITMGGEVTLDGGTVNAGMCGIMAGSESVSAESTVIINGGEINIGSSDRLMVAAMSAWSTIGGEVLDFSGISLDIDVDEYSGVSTTGTLILNGDVDMVMGEMTLGETSGGDAKQVTDFYLSGGNAVIVSNKVNGRYSLRLDGQVRVGRGDVFVPANSAQKIVYTETGEIVIIPIEDDEEFIEYARVSDMSVSTNGDIRLNIFTEIDPAFVVSGRVRFYVQYVDGLHVYSLEDAEIVEIDGVTKYKFSIHTAAKDYADTVNCFFVIVEDPTLTEEDPFESYINVCVGSQVISIQNYLDTIISSRAYNESTVTLAKAMKNYCAAAAYHFEVAENYAVVEGMAPALNTVTVDILDEFIAMRGAAFNNSPLIFKTATVVLKSETSIRVYFDLAEGYSIQVDENGDYWIVGYEGEEYVKIPLTVTVMGSDTEIPIVVGESGLANRPYYIEIAGVCAKDYFTMYSVNVGGEVFICYSVASYARTVIANKNNAYSEDVVDVAKAMMVYGYYALNYYDGASAYSAE